MSERVNISGNRRFVWIDLIKAIALIWIFLNHVVEQLFGYPYIANPTAEWPPLSERIAQLQPVDGYGLLNIPLNLLRYLGWSGDQGVQLFLIVSGFGLTWGLLARYGRDPLPLGPFYRRRAERVYPLWWGAHLFFMATWVLTGWGLSLTNPATYLSMIGVRITPGLLYYFAPAWWFVGLLIQLYLVYPLLWEGLRRRGPLWLLIISCAVAFVARALGLLFFEGYLDATMRGAIFITRLPEFVFGISLAAWMHQDPKRTDAWLRARSTLLLALAAYALGTVLALTLLGMTVAPSLLGIAVFVLFYALLSRVEHLAGRGVDLGVTIGRRSYSLYLMHHPWILLLVSVGLASGFARTTGGIVAAVVLTVGSAVALEWGVNTTAAILGRWRDQIGYRRTALRVLALGAATLVVLLGVELAVRWLDPQEVLGWGERPSLEPHPEFGWRLQPSQTTRLRWETYDYLVTANSLGFPGPEYPQEKTAGTFRILTVGDAFTSAEGVDTDQAWPRQLEADLAKQMPTQNVEVLNFAITGYGPDQYAAVVESFAPVYQPDLIIIGFFVNDYQDVLWDNAQFQQSIGFDSPPQDSWRVALGLPHLRRYLQLYLREPLAELLRGRPRDHGYFLGNYIALERNQSDLYGHGHKLVTERLEQIKAVADRIGAEVLLVMIPAPVQVCSPDQLAYAPEHVDLSDSERFDLELPQRITQEIASALGFAYYDLRPVLDSKAGECLYQSRNMHWTAEGQRTVADYLASVLVADEHLEE